MSAVFRAARGGLGGRRLQAIIIGLVVLAATAASTLALGMLADAHSPFDHAFAAQHGADVAVTVDTSAASAAQLKAAATAGGVSGATAVAGPFTSESVTAQVSLPGVNGTIGVPLTVVGRPAPGGPVDDLALQQGHWPSSDNQVVLSVNASGPGQLGSTITIGKQVLTIVGIANSVTNTADAWVLPAEINAIANGGSGTQGTGQAQLLYRFAASATTGAIAADIGAVKAALPPHAVLGTVSYLAVRQSEQSNVAPWVPFIIAFGVIALVISVLIVVNVVGGAVVAGTTRIGVLKSIGFTPAQVVGCYVLLVAVPAVIGAVAGVVCGNLLAAPIYAQNAQVYQVGVLGVPFWVDVTVPLTVLVLTVAAAVGPASVAGAMSAVQAIATGRAPRPRHGFAAQRALARLTSVPRPVTLGLATPAARPGRTLVTVVAVLFGAAAVTFGVGLAASLNRVYSDISAGTRMPVQVNVAPPGGTADGPGTSGHPTGGGSGKPPAGKKIVVVGQTPLTAAQRQAITTAIDAQPGTQHYLAETDDNLELPGVANANGGVQVTAYGGGDPAWSNYQLIVGRWYSQSPGTGEIDVNTLFLTDTSLAVGDSYTLVNGGHKVTVKIVGEVFAPGNDVSVFMSPATLAALDPTTAGTGEYRVSLRPGVNAGGYTTALTAALGSGYLVGDRGGDRALVAITTLVAMLTLLIIAVAGLGVLNTVALQVRERAHDIGVFKALGMTPRQTLTMVVCSVAVTGLVAGIIAVPAGIALHHNVLPAMAHAANSDVPASVMSVFSLPEMIGLALAGLVIAVVGALAPASWAARSRTATALRTE
jgi:putative ABC transport system permease protein